MRVGSETMTQRRFFVLCLTVTFTFGGLFFVIYMRGSLSLDKRLPLPLGGRTGAQNLPSSESSTDLQEGDLPKARTCSRANSDAKLLMGESVLDQDGSPRAVLGSRVPQRNNEHPLPDMLPDGKPLKQPQRLTIDEEAELTKLLLERFDEDPSILGITRGSDGRVYSLWPNTIYIRHKEMVNEWGELFHSQIRFGTADVSASGQIPAGVRVIELNVDGDPIREYISSGDDYSPARSMAAYGVAADTGETPVAECEGVDFAEANSSEDESATMQNAYEAIGPATANSENHGWLDMWLANLQGESGQADSSLDALVEAEPSSPLLSRTDREQRARLLLRQYGLEKGMQQLQEVDPEMAERSRYIFEVPTQPTGWRRESDREDPRR